MHPLLPVGAVQYFSLVEEEIDLAKKKLTSAVQRGGSWLAAEREFAHVGSPVARPGFPVC